MAAFDDREILKRLVAQPAARGGNLLVIEPPARVATPGGAENQLPVAPDLLAYAELSTGARLRRSRRRRSSSPR